MNQKLTTTVLLLSIFLGGKIKAQSAGGFSLQQALEYSYTHNVNQQNVELDKKSSVYYRRQVAGIGLPQISSSLDVKDYVNLPTSLLPGQFFGGPPGSYIPVKFGLQYNATATAQVSQILFSSDYMVALQASKEMMNLSEKNIQRTKTEIAASVSKAYYSVLVNRERIKLLDANISKLKKMLDDTKAMNVAGFVEKIDVDRLEVAYNNLLVEKDKLNRLVGISETLLKFQMGYKVTDNISLTDSLASADKNPVTITENQKTEYSLRPEYSLVQSQQKLNQLSLKRYNLGYLPSLVGYGVLSEQAQRNKFDFFDTQKKWYPIGIIGATLNLSLFDGLQNYNRIQQAKITILKTKNTLSNLEQAIDMEISISQVNYKNAMSSLESQKKNMELAKNVLEVTNKKYEQGVGSNLEVINAQTSLKEAETNYFNSLYDMYVAKIDYLKANGSLVK